MHGKWLLIPDALYLKLQIENSPEGRLRAAAFLFLYMALQLTFSEKKYIRHIEYSNLLQVTNNEYMQEGKVCSLINGNKIQDSIRGADGFEKKTDYLLPFSYQDSQQSITASSTFTENDFWQAIAQKTTVATTTALLAGYIPFLSHCNSHIKIFEKIQFVKIENDNGIVCDIRNDIIINSTIMHNNRYSCRNLYLKSLLQDTFEDKSSQLQREFETTAPYFNAMLYPRPQQANTFLIQKGAFEFLHEAIGHFFENISLQKQLAPILQSTHYHLNISDVPGPLPELCTRYIDDMGNICREKQLIHNGLIQPGLQSGKGSLVREGFDKPLLLRMSNLVVNKPGTANGIDHTALPEVVEVEELSSACYDAVTNTVSITISIARLLHYGVFSGYLEPFKLSFQPENFLNNIQVTTGPAAVHSTLCLKKGQPMFTNVVSPPILIHDINV